MTTPVILLDVDGVLNACTRNPDPTIWPDWKEGRAFAQTETSTISYPIRWSPTVVEFLNRIHQEGIVEIRYHTTWQDSARNISDLLGLPHFPVAYAPEFWECQRRSSAREADRIREGRAREPWWKLGAAERVLAEERRPLIWLDDDIANSLSRAEKHRLESHGVPLRAIAPSEYTGLCPRHLKAITAFLTECDPDANDVNTQQA